MCQDFEDDETWFIWEEYDYFNNQLYYEYDLEDLENEPKREKTNNDRNQQTQNRFTNHSPLDRR